jgi:hypothetical protein
MPTCQGRTERSHVVAVVIAFAMSAAMSALFVGSNGPVSAQQSKPSWATPQRVAIGPSDSIMSLTASVDVTYHCVQMAIRGEFGLHVFDGCMELRPNSVPGDFVFRDTTAARRILATGLMSTATCAFWVV